MSSSKESTTIGEADEMALQNNAVKADELEAEKVGGSPREIHGARVSFLFPYSSPSLFFKYANSSL